MLYFVKPGSFRVHNTLTEGIKSCFCCRVLSVFFTPVDHFHFFCKCSFDTWLPDLCIFIFLFPFSGSLLYLHGNLLFVTLSITCFLLAFYKMARWGDAVSMSRPSADFIMSSLIIDCYLLTLDSFCACACLKLTALWSIQNEYWCTQYIYQRHCWSWLLMLSIWSCLKGINPS